MTSNSPPSLIIGTAGHIDHGKTALVRALTGTDTDRLPEEKQRGMTIDIGFAQMRSERWNLAFIDVPGHERLIKNMLAGAATIDLAMLVVAADDAVMPQTREHLAIFDLLQVRHGVVALSKCDLRDDDWLELVEEEIRELLASKSLAQARIIRTSLPADGEAGGIDTLREELIRVAANVPTRSAAGPVRLGIDRVFSSEGQGTVVTGSLASGSITTGKELEVLPEKSQVTVRSLHSFNVPVEVAKAGQRVAINVTGDARRRLHRGNVLATPGFLSPTNWLTVKLTALPDPSLPVVHRRTYRIHLGTQVTSGRLILYGENQLAANDSAIAQLKLTDPVVAIWGQPLVLRSESPVATLAGGTVVQPTPLPIRRSRQDLLERLTSLLDEDPLIRAEASLYFFGKRDWRPQHLIREAGWPVDQVEQLWTQFCRREAVVVLGGDPSRGQVLHRVWWNAWRELTLELVTTYHKNHPLRLAAPRAEILPRLTTRAGALWSEAVVEKLLESGQLQGDRQSIALAQFAPQLSNQQQVLFDQIVADFNAGKFQPPTPGELAERYQIDRIEIGQLIQLGVDQAQLVHVSGDVFLSTQTADELPGILRHGSQPENWEAGLTVAQIRDILGTTRKFAIPLCEYADQSRITQRKGDLRTLR